MNEKEFNGLILAELVKIANEVFTNEIEIAPGTYTAAELAKLKDANGNEINIKYLCVDAKLNITDFRTVQINSFKCSFPVDQVFNLVWQFEKLIGMCLCRNLFTVKDESHCRIFHILLSFGIY